MTTFPAITLWQPWASLIFAGVKTYETRAFPIPTKYQGRWVAIHAAKGFPRSLPPGLGLVMLKWLGTSDPGDLMLGDVLGIVLLGTPIRTEDLDPDNDERAAGDWSPGRWAWPILKSAALARPVPAVGRQGWFSVDLAIAEPPK